MIMTWGYWLLTFWAVCFVVVLVSAHRDTDLEVRDILTAILLAPILVVLKLIIDNKILRVVVWKRMKK